MHELSVAQEICRIAEDNLGAEQLPYLCELGIVVGDDSGLEAANLEFCLQALLAEPPYTGARVQIARVPGDALRLDYLEVDDERPGH